MIFLFFLLMQPSLFAKSSAEKCESLYQSLLSRPVFEVRMIFGYKDSRPARFVGDRYDRVSFIQALVADCKPDQKACGFKRTPHDSDLFLKMMKGAKNQDMEVKLWVVNSSAAADDDVNRMDPLQKPLSEYAEKMFIEGLRTADVVFYNGHSRTGGGPDFHPPQLTLEGFNVDLSFYTKNKLGLKSITRTLDEDKEKKLKLLGLFSCASSGHFSDEILEVRPGLGFIGSKQLLYYTDALQNSLAALESLLGRKCSRDFKAALRSSSPSKGSQIFGLF